MKVKILDGSCCTQVSTNARKDADGDPLWTARFLVTDPDAVRAAHLDFLRAGSDIIETNTYQASIDGFKKYLGMSECEGLALITKAVQLAREAVEIYKNEVTNENKSNKNPLIAGSCGPYGATLHDGSEYTGSYGKDMPVEFFKDWHRPRVKTLLQAGVDLLAFETIPCSQEATGILELLQEFPNTKAWLSFSCSKDGKMADGSDLHTVGLSCWNKAQDQLLAIGANCVNPMLVTTILKQIRSEEDPKSIPLIVYPNSGEVFVPGEGWKDERKIQGFENYIPEWLDEGVEYIGGCCRTSSMDIENIRAQVEAWNCKKKSSVE